MKTATINQLDEVYSVFRQHKEYFPHIRKDKLQREIENQNIIFDSGVVLAHQMYKRAVSLGNKRFEKGTAIIHQIANKNQGNGNAYKILNQFINSLSSKCRCVLTVRKSNNTARKFYERNGFNVVGKIKWSNNSIDGLIYETYNQEEKQMKDLVTQLKSKDVYSIDTRGKPTTTKMFFNQISKIHLTSTKLKGLASVGFYRSGQLLVKAKKELGTDFGKLKKRLEENGFHQKQQERFMAIANNPKIKLLYNKLPPEWTFWEKITRLMEQDRKQGTKNFQKIEHLIHNKAKYKDIEEALGRKSNSNGGKSFPPNAKDNRNEIFGMEIIVSRMFKKHKNEFNKFEKEIKKLASKYKFIKLKKKNYFDEAFNHLKEMDIKDDTTAKKVKFKETYSSKKKINI